MKVKAFVYPLVVALLATFGLFSGVSSASAVEGQADVSVSSVGPITLWQNDPFDGVPDHVVGNSNVHFTVAVKNNDPSVTATGVTIVVDDPGFLVFDGSSDKFPCALVGTSVSCTIGDLAPGRTLSVDVNARVKPGVFGEQTYGATVTSTTVDPNVDNNHAQASHTFTDEADLAARLTVNGGTPGQVSSTGLTTVGFAMVNLASTKAWFSEVTFTYPVGFKVVDVDERCSVDVSLRMVSCFGSPQAGWSVGATVQLEPTPGISGPFTFSATVVAGPHDPNPSNNTVTYTVPGFSDEADLTITPSADAISVRAGQKFTWTATVTNAGPATAENLLLDFYHSVGMVVVSAPADCVAVGERVDCKLESLAVGATWSKTFTVMVPRGAGQTDFTVGAFLASDTPDPDGQVSNIFTSVTVVKGKTATRPTRPPT